MSSDFSTVLVRDSVLGGITDKLTYAVKSGAASKTYQPFQSISQSASSLTFNVTVPSENVVVDREVFIKSTIRFTVTETGVADTAFAGGYGSQYALQAFPLNHLFTTASATINNSNVSSNIQDILPQLLQMMSQEELAKYDGMCPNLVDFNTALYTTNIATSNANNVLATANQTGYSKYFQPRGSYPVKLVDFSRKVGSATPTKTLTSSGVTDVFKLAYEVEVFEPIIGLSPFIYGQPAYNNQGLVGINAMNFVFNIDSTAKRFLSVGVADTVVTKVELGINVDGGTTNSAIPFAGTELVVCFNSSQSTDLITAKNVVPYTDIPRFITVSNVAVPGQGTEKSLSSNNIQLNQLPDLFIICVRKSIADMTVQDAEYNCVINSVSINLNNASGLLSSANQFSLYQLSVKNGSKQTWSQFSGRVNQLTTKTGGSSGNGGLGNQATTGSIFVVSPTDLSLPSYLAPGCIGSFNFQVKLGVTQYVTASSANITPEIVILAVNSGIFSTVAGSSQIFTGILTKSLVEDAKSMQMVNPVLSAEYNRVLGGGIHGDMQNSGNEQMPAVKEAMKQKMKMAHSMGSGVYSGGAMSGGKFSGMVR
jgi:hypothetical protein